MWEGTPDQSAQQSSFIAKRGKLSLETLHRLTAPANTLCPPSLPPFPLPPWLFMKCRRRRTAFPSQMRQLQCRKKPSPKATKRRHETQPLTPGEGPSQIRIIRPQPILST